MFAGGMLNLIAVLLFALGGTPTNAQAQVSGTHSPHGNLTVPCQNCHTPNGWKPIRAVPEFDHNRTRYPLRGMHTAVACTGCHVKPVFTNVGQRCQDCHADIHKRQLGANCEQCHTVRGWQVSIQQIQQHNNRFPLTGAHAAVDCDACHKGAANSKFQTMSTECYSCHASEYQNTKNPNHAASKFSIQCDTCHATDNWFNAKFDHSTTGFPLSGGHAVPPRECTDCHVNNNYNLSSTACISCHQTDFNNATTPVPHTGFPTTCEQCHDTVQWTDGKFDHSTTGFTLTGAHTVPPRACTDCHVNNNYNLTSTTCVTCHLKDYQGTTNPSHVAGNFSQQCQTCHTTTAWTPATFDHSTVNFTLTGAHTVPPRACTDCHVNNNYNLTSTACVSCHLNDFNNTTNPNHVQQGFAQTCETCHTTTAWSPATFDHSKSGFPLTGAHTVPPRACTDCHVNNNYSITVTTCVSCHQTDYNNAKTPVPHTGFPTTCEQCHDTVQWTDGKFDHSTTGFPLTGSHTVPPRVCADCHVNNNYNITVTTCVSCHQTDYNNAKTPVPHTGFPTTCEQCHDTVQWTDGKFDHSTTGFTLTGAHTVPPRACTDCHVNGNYNLTSTTCVTCHLTDYNNTNNPSHVQQGFSQVCETCHNTAAWSPASFDHSKSGFPLTGSHTVPPRACADCHVNNNYNITVTTCVSCHQTDYNNAKSPVPHTGFPTTCEQCHDTIAWTDGKFDHSTTGFTLTGMHTVPPRQCTDCHVNNNYSLNSTACVTCHLKDYQGATNPNHVSANFPQTCETCHDTTNWMNATFNHNSTGFPLVGSHTVPPRQCTDCHVNNNYNLNTTTCVSCHLKDYQGTTNPNHVAANFPQTCETCHDTVVWTDSTFNHTTTGFQLTGAHTVPPRACTDCHVNNNYSLNTTACVSCHLKDYQSTTNPNHVTANFPQTCETCHDTVVWTDSTFNHTSTGFTLTGAHTVPPRQCTDCHVNNNYNITVTTCVSCHLKDYQGTTNPNHVAANFSQSCETCHDTVNWNDATFNHNTTGFTLTGQHLVPPRTCNDCHVNNNYSLNSTACVNCHLKDYQGATNPNHVQANFPQTCETCHDTTNWTDATFNHSTTGFNLTGAHTVPPRQCTDCHINNNYNITVTTCVSCHQTDYNNAKSPVDHISANFPTTCETCHDTVLWTDGKFDHTTTGFTLTGSHTVPPRTCTDCHVNNNYTLNSTLCYSCHQKDYAGTTNPNHATLGFPTTCELCHDTVVWTDSTFDHSKTTFPLTGSHTVPPRVCTDCHVNGNYTTLPTACYGCHQTDYQNTTNPGHAAQQQFFPQTCQDCHNTTAWTGATFNHTQYTKFPTNHGNANNVCATCHTNSNDYSVFQCTTCHTKNQTDGNHQGVKGYVYNSVNCYQCHPSGKS